jgi:hypothetical protein
VPVLYVFRALITGEEKKYLRSKIEENAFIGKIEDKSYSESV